MNDLRNLFVFEGNDKVGKTTLSRALAARLASRHFRVYWASFPGRDRDSIGAWVYQLHHQSNAKINPLTLQLLHVAAHIDNISRSIIPALEENDIVILDRFWWSTAVYGRIAGVSDSDLYSMIEIEKRAWGVIQPSRIFLIVRDEPFEGLPMKQWATINEGYSKLVEKSPSQNIIQKIINDRPIDEIVDMLEQRVTEACRR